MTSAEARNHVLLCQEIESELRELCLECRKKFPSIKEYTERAILKIRHHRDSVEPDGRAADTLPEFPLDEVLTVMMMACETFQNKIVLLSLTCLQRLIHRKVLKEGTVAIVINLMKEQATNGDESVQLKVLQTIMATPAHLTLLNELVVEQLMQLLYVLHNSSSASVHHTACAGIRQIAEHLADRAAAQVAASAGGTATGSQGDARSAASMAERVRPAIQRSPAAIPTITPAQAPAALTDSLRMFYIFVQDLCVMADYDASSLSSRYAVDAGERMRTGSREGYWLANIKFPRPLCLELLGTCVAAHPEIFFLSLECFTLLRHTICAVLLKNLRGCFDFAILIRSIHLLQQILKSPGLAALLMQEMQVFLHLMLDLTTAERSPWQRATALEFLKSVCENPAILAVLYDHGTVTSGPADSGTRTFLELVNSLSKLMHQVCFSSDWGALLQSAAGGGGSSSSSSADRQRGINFDMSMPLLDGGALQRGAASLLGKTGLMHAAGLQTLGLAVSSEQAHTATRSGGGGSGGGPGSDSARRGRAANPKLLVLMNEAEPPVIQPSFLVSLVVECVFAIVSTLYRLLLEAGEETKEVPHTFNGGGSSVVASSPPVGPGNAANTASSAELLMVSTLGSSRGGATSLSRTCLPLRGQLNSAQQRCRGMLSDCWASLVSALSLLLHGTTDEAFLQQALRCLQTLLYCCSRLGLDQARETCLLQLARYALPGESRELEVAEASSGASSSGLGGGGGGSSSSSSSATTLTPKNALCCKALLNFSYCFGALLGVPGWTIALRAIASLERLLRGAPAGQASHLTMLRNALDTVFETTAFLPVESIKEIIEAMGKQLKNTTDVDDGSVVLNRLVELCSFNLPRLLSIWAATLQIILDMCAAELRGELRGAAAAALCRILAQALRKGALEVTDGHERAQEELLRPLEGLLRVPQKDTRARVCEGLLSILQASGQELHPAAWGTTLRLVAAAARLELEKAGLEFFLPKALDPYSEMCNDFKPPPRGAAIVTEPSAEENGSSGGAVTASRSEGGGGQPSSVLPTVFQLLELLVHDFMEYVPPDSVPALTASIGAFARFTGLGVNSSLTAVGFLWNVADALARYHCVIGDSSGQASRTGGEATAVAADNDGASPQPSANFEELWIQIFVHLRVLAVDNRPEVRNCAVKSLTAALLSHGRKVGTQCYRRCLQDILIKVLAELQDACRRARESSTGGSGGKGGDANLIVHHSRDTLEKQWDETMVLGLEGVRRVLSHFAEEAGVVAFAPLAYALLLQVQTTLRLLSTEVSGAALRSLVDLMRIPASHVPFDVQTTAIAADTELPVPSGGKTSVWLLGWNVLWRMVGFCMCREVPESLMETFASTLTALRGSHRHVMTPAQNMVWIQLALVLVTAPSFYLPSSQPFKFVGDEPVKDEDGEDSGQRLGSTLAGAVDVCRQDATARQQGESGSAVVDAAVDAEVFDHVARCPEVLWSSNRFVDSARQPPAYSKASVAVQNFVDENKSKNADIRSMEAAVSDAQSCDGNATLEDLMQAFLGPKGSPTHRTMLHISSSRLQHVQGFVFVLLEETPGFTEPFLEVCFLAQCCALFLDAKVVLRDTNKLALAARTLCLLVLFCRRVVLRNLSGAAAGGSQNASGPGSAPSYSPAEHLEALIAAMPQLFHVVTCLACSGTALGGGVRRYSGALRSSGIWKLALEGLLYVIEDTLPVVERGVVSSGVVTAYWQAVVESLTQVVKCAFYVNDSNANLESAPKVVATDSGLLAQAVGNLLVHKLLACSSAPQDVSERAVRLLGDLAGLQSVDGPPQGCLGVHIGGSGASSNAPSTGASAPMPCPALGHLFDLCSAPETAAGEQVETANCEHSAAALAVRCNLATASTSGGATASRAVPTRLPDRSVLLSTAVPSLLERARATLAAYDAAERAATAAATAAAAATGGGHAAAVVMIPPQRVTEVLFVLSRLKAFQADQAMLAALAPALPSDRARAACELAGRRGLSMALMPELAALAGSGDARVSREVRAVLEGLVGVLGLSSAS